MSKQKLCMLLIMSTLFNAGCMREINRSLTRHEAKESYYSGNFARSFRLTEAMAYEGDVKAEYSLGYMYYYGIGAPENKPLGMAWIKEAALKGYPPAVFAIKKINRDPLAFSQKEPENNHAEISPGTENSAQDLNKLALMGDKNAQYTLGYMYYYGKGIAQNKELGMSLIKLSAENGNSKAIVAKNKLEEFMNALAENDNLQNKSLNRTMEAASIEPKLIEGISENIDDKPKNVIGDESEFLAKNQIFSEPEKIHLNNEFVEKKIETTPAAVFNIEHNLNDDPKESLVEKLNDITDEPKSISTIDSTPVTIKKANSEISKSSSEYQWLAQLFTFSVKENATTFVNNLKNKNLPVFAKHNMGNNKNLTIVFLGPVDSKQSLVKLLDKIDKKYGLRDVIVRKDIKLQDKAFALKENNKPQDKLTATLTAPVITGNHFCRENPISLKANISEEDPPFIMGGQFWDSLS